MTRFESWRVVVIGSDSLAWMILRAIEAAKAALVDPELVRGAERRLANTVLQEALIAAQDADDAQVRDPLIAVEKLMCAASCRR